MFNFSRENKEFRYIVLINILFLIVFNLMFYPRFHSDLDILMQSGIYGICGINSSYILYSNILIGKMLTILQGLFPDVAWYMIFHCSMSFIAISIIAYITMKRNKGFMGKLISIIIIAFLGYECYIEPSYMKTAVILIVSASYLFFYADETKRRDNVIVVLVLAVISSMICFSTFVLFAPISFGIVLLKCFRQKINKKWIITTIITIFGIVILSTSLYVFDNAIYKYAGREETLAYRNVLERILGYGIPTYSEELIEELGITDSNHYAMSQVMLMITDKEDFEKLEQFSKMSMLPTFENVGQFFRQVPISWFGTGMLYYLIILSAMCCIGLGKKGTVIKLTIALLVEYFVFYMSYAWQHEWISFIIMLPLSLLLLIELRDMSAEETVDYAVYVIILAIVLYTNFSGTMLTSIKEDETTSIFGDLSEDTIYMVDMVKYLRVHSVYQVYDMKEIPSNVYLINTGYALMEEFESSTNLPSLEEGVEQKYEWLYNPLQFSLDGIFIQKMED